jgi:hypothetical protein
VFLSAEYGVVSAKENRASTTKKSSDPSKSSEPSKTSGISKRTIDFHSSESLGNLTIVWGRPEGYPSDLSSCKFAGAAQGKITVSVPPGCELCYEPNSRVLAHPQLMDSISGDAIDILRVNSVSLDESESERGNALMPHVNHLARLRELFIDRSDVTDAGLSKLHDLNSLEVISGFETLVAGSCFKDLCKFPNLSMLCLRLAQLKDENLKYLPNMHKLTYLNLRQVKLSKEALAQLSKCSSLRKLLLDRPEIDDSWLPLLTKLKNLDSLDLIATSITDKGLPTLTALKHLRALNLCGAKVTPQGLAVLAPMHLQTLMLTNNNYDAAQLKKLHEIAQRVELYNRGLPPPSKTLLKIFAPITRSNDR